MPLDYNLVDIDGTTAEPMAGIAARVYIAPRKDFTTVKEPPATLEGYTDVDELATVVGPHVFPTGKGFTTLEGVEETGALNITLLGGNEMHIFQNELTIKLSGTSALILGFLRLVKNMRCIMLVEEVGSGALRQMGSARFPARFTGITAAMEAALEGENSVTLTVQDKQKWPAPVYTGAVPLKPVE